MTKDILSELRKALKANIDEKTKNGFQRYFKERVICHGIKSAAVVRIAKEYFKKIKSADLQKKEVFALCKELFKSGYCEESFIAANWTYWLNNYKEQDFPIYERWITEYIDNWAECDTFCNHTVGSFIEKYPEYVQKLKIWAKSKNRWVKRAAAVSLILPARKGKFLKDIFEIADSLLLDKDDMVQKGYGWMLKEASRKHQKEVFNYVMKCKKDMPRIALRYAIEKTPQNLRAKAMAKD